MNYTTKKYLIVDSNGKISEAQVTKGNNLRIIIRRMNPSIIYIRVVAY